MLNFGFGDKFKVFAVDNNRVERSGFGGETNAKLFAIRFVKTEIVHICTD